MSLNNLAPATQTNNDSRESTGGTEDELLSCLRSLVGSSYLFDLDDDDKRDTNNIFTLDKAIRILLNSTVGSSEPTRSMEQRGGALRYFVHLFLPVTPCGSAEIWRKFVTLSSESWKGGTRNIHMLNEREYHQFGVQMDAVNSDVAARYVRGGYYRAANLYITLGLVSADESPMLKLNVDKDCRKGRSTISVASQSLRRLCGLFGKSKISLDAIINIWEGSLDDVEHKIYKENIPKQSKIWRKQKRRCKNTDKLHVENLNILDNSEEKESHRRDKKVSIICGSYQWAIGATEFLHYTLLGLIDDEMRAKFQATSRCKRNPKDSASRGNLMCALCGKIGQFTSSLVTENRTNSIEARSEGSSLPALLRCSKCQVVYYCCKSHQKKHWGEHKIKCTVAVPTRPIMKSNKLYSSLLHISPRLVKAMTSFLRSSLRNTASPLSSNTSAMVTMHMLLVSGLLEVLSTLFFDLSLLLNDLAAQRALLEESERFSVEIDGECFVEQRGTLNAKIVEAEKVKRAFMLDVLFPLLSFAVNEGVGTDNANISRQAARTTLSRISLYMGYSSGPDMLRCNLDHIVDAVCLQLQHLQRKAKHFAEQPSLTSSTALIGSREVVGNDNYGIANAKIAFEGYDSHIVVVVGSVLEAILMDDARTSSALIDGNDIEMLLRDMVSKTLSTIDLLSSVATTTSSHVASSLTVQVAPLLDLMHSLVRTSVKPLEHIPMFFLSQADRSHLPPLAEPRGELSTQLHHHKGLFASNQFFTNESTNSALSNNTGQDVKLSNDLFRIDLCGNEGDTRDIAQALNEFNRQWLSYHWNDKKSFCEENKFDALQGVSVQGNDGGDDEVKSEEDDTPPVELELIVKVLEKCHYFIACAELSAQVSVVNIMISGFCRLAKNKKLCLPALHKAWPSIMSRIKELRTLYVLYSCYSKGNGDGQNEDKGYDGMASISKLFLLPHLLHLVSLLAYICGDFISMKFKEDLWPELMVIMHICSEEVLQSLPFHQNDALCADKHQLSCASQNAINDSKKLHDPGTASLQRHSKFSLLEKLKCSLLLCLLHLAGMTTHDITLGPMSGSCISPDVVDGDSNCNRSMANPLAPIAPLCMWLILPLVAATQAVVRHTVGNVDNLESRALKNVSDTFRELAKLNRPFALSLSEAILAMAKKEQFVSSTATAYTFSETQLSPLSAWEGIRAYPVIADSYHTVNNITQLHTRPGRHRITSATMLVRLLNSGRGWHALISLCNELHETL